MGDLMTASHHVSGSDYGEVDQDGKLKTHDTVLFCLKHPPFICVSTEARDTLYGLEPPSSLTSDWTSELVHNQMPSAWEAVNYEDRYRKHLRTDSKAKEDLLHISMLTKTEDVCLLCQCDFYQFCTRRIVYEYLSENGDIDP